jgi:hypothetical protein
MPATMTGFEVYAFDVALEVRTPWLTIDKGSGWILE